jgi:penicillin amidase
MTSRNRSNRDDFPYLQALLIPAAAAGGAMAAAAAVRRVLHRSVPRTSGSLTADGLRRPVEIVRDRWGVPHIYAQNADDLFVAQGYVQAQDRLFQMDLHRRLGLGRLSEVIGPRGLAFDRFARYLGWPRAAQKTAAGSSGESRVAIDAFCLGVNSLIRDTFKRAHPLPPEFTALAYRPEPWRAIDTAAWGIVIGWGLSCNWETELLRSWLVEALGPERAADMTLEYDDDYPTTLPDTQVGRRLAEALVACYHDTMAHLPLGVPMVGQGIGSNNWAVSGRRTASGRPHLANDPHLPPSLPALWHACHLVGGGYDVAGFSMPGVPGVIIGHNAHCAWGVTNAFPDLQDIFIERFDPADRTRYEVNGEWQAAEIVHESIPVRGRKPVAFDVRYTRHGPVFSDLLLDPATAKATGPAAGRTSGQTADLSLAWTLFEGGDHLRAVLDTNRAADWSGFREGLRHWAFPSQNVVYADTSGTIAYMMPGRVPVRREGDGLAPKPGWDDRYGWEGFIPFEEMPALVNPPEGFIATANNFIAGDAYAHHLTSEWLPGYRVRRIRDLLGAGESLTMADEIRIQNDTVSLMARRFRAAALPILRQTHWDDPADMEAVGFLEAWDGDMRADSVAATIHYGLLTGFTRGCIEQAVGPDLAGQLLGKGGDAGFPLMPFYEIAAELAVRWLEQGAPAWVGDVRPLLWLALHNAVMLLRETLGSDPYRWTWGTLHQTPFEHQLSQLPGIGRLWKPLRVPAGGDGYTVSQQDTRPAFPPEPVTIIPSCRLLMDVGAWDDCLAALPGGQSGHPYSPHYQDGIAGWAAGQYFPLLYSRERVLGAAGGRLVLRPSLC